MTSQVSGLLVISSLMVSPGMEGEIQKTNPETGSPEVFLLEKAELALPNLAPSARFYMAPSSIGDLHMLTKEIE